VQRGSDKLGRRSRPAEGGSVCTPRPWWATDWPRPPLRRARPISRDSPPDKRANFNGAEFVAVRLRTTGCGLRRARRWSTAGMDVRHPIGSTSIDKDFDDIASGCAQARRGHVRPPGFATFRRCSSATANFPNSSSPPNTASCLGGADPACDGRSAYRTIRWGPLRWCSRGTALPRGARLGRVGIDPRCVRQAPVTVRQVPTRRS
jgi:hypothetical protein